MKGYSYAHRANLWDEIGCADTDDPVEAALASGCNCLNNHCPALSSIPRPARRPRIVRRFNPDSDSQRIDETDTQADGDQGEGAE